MSNPNHQSDRSESRSEDELAFIPNSVAILLVDDLPLNLMILERFLCDMGYLLVKASSGKEALRMSLEQDFALVLLDMQMPEINGHETARLLHSNPKTRHIPIIFVTAGSDDIKDVFESYNVGAVDHIVKPVHPKILRSKVAVFARLYQQRLMIEHQKNHLQELVELRTAQLQRTAAELKISNDELREHRLNLERTVTQQQERIDEAITELRQKDQLMISQSRQAAMGEMIGNIAHQWRQPLNALSMVLGNIQSAHHYNELTSEHLAKRVEKGNHLIQKMSSTINDFRNFFLPDKEVASFSARDQINHAVSLVEAGLTSQNIIIHLEADQDIMLTGFPNEYSQVLLNLLTNSRDAIKGSGVLAGIITISLYDRNGQSCTSVRDNGGGIPADVIDKIFEPYFSTKDMGTGIGLYMSKMIIERSMNGTIEAKNSESGAEFVIVTPIERRLP
jgi:C4-dicarboxylate-specific signal transduction histidine kinase